MPPMMKRAGMIVVISVFCPVAFCDEIHNAAEGGNVEQIRALLRTNPELVHAKGRNEMSWGYSPLHVAANKDVAELLLDHKADVDAIDNRGMTPLQKAALRNNKDVAKVLILHNASVNAKRDDGMTALHWAAICGGNEVITLLLANKADINAAGKDGWTPLHFAVHHRQKKAAEFLVARGAELDIWAASGLGMIEQIKKLLAANVRLANATQPNGETPLLWAVRNGQKEAAEVLLTYKADVNVTTIDPKYGPLEEAVYRNDKVMVELLLVHNANVNARHHEGRTALAVAVSAGYKEIAEILRAHGAVE